MPFEKSVADVAFMRGDYEGAAKMYLDGAREGDETAAFDYGYCLLHGYGVPCDPSQAKSFFSYARDMSGGESCYNLAMLYLEGRGVVRDYRTAIAYMSDAADLGCVEAMLYLGMAYTVGYVYYPEITSISMIPFHKPEYRDTSRYVSGEVGDFEEDDERRATLIGVDGVRAFDYFKAAASADPTYVKELVSRGKYLYAMCYLEGFGTDFNRASGLRLMLNASKSGSSDAEIYLVEHGITENMIEGVNNTQRRLKR